MTEQALQPNSLFFDDFKFQQNAIKEKTISNFKQIISNILIIEDNNHFLCQVSSNLSNLAENETDIANNIIQTNNEIIGKFKLIQKEAQFKNKETSCDFNILRLFSINEVMHSFLLANMLNPHSEHGQGNIFLIAFLKKLRIESPERGQWIVSAEKGRIDILLKRKYPHSVIIIENKSNYAYDQPNQLYKYWFREIYKSQSHKGYNYSKNHPEKYQIVFLTPADWKQPSLNTITRPKGNEWSSLGCPDIMPIEPQIWKFNIEIVNWLNDVYKDIPIKNYRLKEYIKQYIEFWQ